MVAPSPAPTSEQQARAWLPGAYHSIGAACLACGGLDGLVYSAGDAYVCCKDCGWQRRLLTPQERLHAALAATGHRSWIALLIDLDARDPDPLPPVAALLWRQTGPDTWQGPSRSTPDTEYVITRYPSGHVHCDCPHWGRGCWHRKRSQELGCIDLTASEDLFG